LAAEANCDAAFDRPVVKNVLEIGAAEIDVVPAKRAADSIDGDRFPDGTFRIHELEPIDRVADGLELGNEP
jgi:hypothetical protein